MKNTHFFFTFLSLLTLSACSLNTKFDDDDYRPVGASSPVNSKTHTISETHQPVVANKDNVDSISTRYTRPGSEKIPTGTSTTAMVKKPIKTEKPVKDTDNIINRTINNIFNSRYGDSDIILKIAKTVNIHCQQSIDKPIDNSQMTLCEYQFPDYCGAHNFSLLTNKNKQLLMFHDNKYERNIIDTIRGNKQSAPGLWDGDDYVSSNLLTVRQLINNKTIDTNDLGWIMSVSDNEKARLGRSYFAAINEARKCF